MSLSTSSLNISEKAKNALLQAAWKKAKRIAEIQRLTEHDYVYRGANAYVQTATDPELLLVGAAGTGKTLAILDRINKTAWGYPGSRSLIVRKVRADLAESILVTFERDILGFQNPICAGVSRSGRHSYKYPNGSTIVVGGMDRPGRVLSAEYDLVYAAEAVQFSEEDWETLVMRIRNGVTPTQQLIADTNPDTPTHWLKIRCDHGHALLLNTYHHDNPRWHNGDDWTADGQQYIFNNLDRLTGVRRKRYLEGKWVAAEGVIYEGWDDGVHLIDAFDIPADWPRYRAIDFGYTNPFVCQWFAADPDGRLHLYREIYHTQRLVSDHARLINTLSEGERISFTIADHDAEDRATLHAAGIPTRAAKKDVTPGIEAVQQRLRIAGDDKPRLFIHRGALVERDRSLADAKKPTSTAEEFPGYIWEPAKDGKPVKESPVKLDDHGVDALRYMVMALDGPRNFKVLFEV